MHTYTNAWGLPPVRVAYLRRADLVWLTSISDAKKRRDPDNNFGKENNDSDSDVDDKGGLFPMIQSVTFERNSTA